MTDQAYHSWLFMVGMSWMVCYCWFVIGGLSCLDCRGSHDGLQCRAFHGWLFVVVLSCLSCYGRLVMAAFVWSPCHFWFVMQACHACLAMADFHGFLVMAGWSSLACLDLLVMCGLLYLAYHG